MVAEPVILDSWCLEVMATDQDMESLRPQLEELNAQMDEMRQSTNAAVTGLTEVVKTMGQSVSKPRPEDMRVGKPEPYVLGKDFDDWDLYVLRRRWCTPSPACPTQLKAARQWTTAVMATAPHEQQCATPLYFLTMLTEDDRAESWKQRLRSLQPVVLGVRNFHTGGQRGAILSDYDIQVRFQDRGRGRPSERISGVGEAIRRGERYRSRSRPR